MIKSLFRPQKSKISKATIDISDVLRSGENGLSSHQYARMTNNILRPSTRFIDGPHVAFLRDFERLGSALFEDAHFFETDYYKNAAECISYTGRYFEARAADQIKGVAENFVAAHRGQRVPMHIESHGHNAPNDPIIVAKVADSRCWALISGNHRLASRYVNGEKTAIVEVSNTVVRTPLQEILRDVHWQKNRIELYQPVPFPEVAGWPLVRKCADRGDLLAKHLDGSAFKTAIDVGCSYGWFVSLLSKRGLETFGVDRDLFALKVAELVYGIDPRYLIRADILDYLRLETKRFDVVTCFSVLHHFALGLGSIGPEEFIRLLDRVTGSVLYFDTGQAHEEWFKDSLRVWDNAYIIDFVKQHTTFRNIQILGVDQDNNGNYAGNYGRTLFVCSR